ncbi:MAG: carboxypeptidase-like regulatory domain-containing protein [Bacteroidia bacterium]|nr:carboxypeptidase-like regulatory domain-containing protein [Bacteroidia bacterium]NNL78929.1 carboxypeptidase-like regulatory domain-containing protein [Flavobacteriaceae bacterium]
MAQEIQGVVRDGDTNLPLESASVYFDNTTIGTITDNKGAFSLEWNPEINSSLIISYLGYESIRMGEFDTEAINEIYLFESENVLDEVVLYGDDGWSRELKINEFRKHYLGDSFNGKSCEILNEDDLILHYDKRRKRLTAKSAAPIEIINRGLQYQVTADLKSFEINYNFVSKNKKRLNVNYVYYAGANFYRSLQKQPTKITIEKRVNTYNGSVLHFMRSLSKQNLRNEGFRIYVGNSEVHPRRSIKIRKIEDSNGVYVSLKDRLNIIYRGSRQSSVESFVDEFFIDSFGNHSPTEDVRFGGDLGEQRMGDTLPLDYVKLKMKSSSSSLNKNGN